MVKDINKICLEYWREAVRNLPPALDGQGGQDAIWFASKRIMEMGVPQDLAIELMLEIYNPLCDKPWSYQEINRTVRRAFSDDCSDGSAISRWPKIDRSLRDGVVEDVNLSLSEFSQWSASPYNSRAPFFFLDRLFPENPFLCLGKKADIFRTERKEWWTNNVEDIQLVVPNAMTSQFGLNQEGFPSQRSNSNTGPKQYQVIEFDISEYEKSGLPSDDRNFIRRLAREGFSVDDINASLIAHLATKAPLVMAVHSAGKSLHGWFRVKDVPIPVQESFFAYACQLGADRKLWSPCQMVRMPDGIRENGKIQHVKYFNPNNI